MIDQNTQVQSYMHLQVTKPYIALKPEAYISIRKQEELVMNFTVRNLL